MGRAATAKTASSLASPAAKAAQTKSGAVSAAGPAAAKDRSRSRTGQCPLPVPRASSDGTRSVCRPELFAACGSGRLA